MKNTTKKLLSAVILTALILPTASFANYWNWNNWNFQENHRNFNLKEFKEKIRENREKRKEFIENAPSEIKKIHEKRKNWEEISEEEKEKMKAFFKENWINKKLRKSKKRLFRNMSIEEISQKINSNENLTDEQKEKRIWRVIKMKERMAERKAKVEEVIKTAPSEIKAIYEKKKNWEKITKEERNKIRTYFKENIVKTQN